MTICANLERLGYRRDQIKKLDRWYALRVLDHPKDDRGRLDPQYREDDTPPLSHRDLVKAALRRRKVPEHRMDEAADRAIAEQEARKQAKRKRGRGRGRTAGGDEGPAG